MTPKEFLLEVANTLEYEGWMQGSFTSLAKHNILRNTHAAEYSVCRCVYGAMEAVSYRGCLNTQTYSTAFNALQRRVCNNICFWNDSPGQTKENVIKTIREVAETL